MKLKHIATIGLALTPTAAFAGPAINGAGATFPRTHLPALVC